MFSTPLFFRLLRNRIAPVLAVIIFVVLSADPASAQALIKSVPTGPAPHAIAVNPVTHRVYTAEWGGSNVDVIDGVTHAVKPVRVGQVPQALAVNPTTNKIYVVNCGASGTQSGGQSICTGTGGLGYVTVIDGVTNTTTSITVGKNPQAVAINPLTNQIYVANSGDATLSVIDGVSNTVTSVAVGTNPWSIAINVVTNKIYVSNGGSNTVSVIDGATHAVATVTVGSGPVKLAVNPTTNKIYVANRYGNTVTVIDGATNGTASVATDQQPMGIAINPVTNKIYVSNAGSNTVTLIDGATNATTTLTVGAGAHCIGIDTATNQVYVGLYNESNVAVIDGVTNAVRKIPSPGNGLDELTVDPLTHRVYISERDFWTVLVLAGETYGYTSVPQNWDTFSIAVNPATHKAYIADGVQSIVVYDAVLQTSTRIYGIAPQFSVAVNPVTNKIYATNLYADTVTIVDGVTLTVSTVKVSHRPTTLAVNTATNKIYALGASEITEIEGTTLATATIPTLAGFAAPIAINELTNQLYVPNYYNASVSIIDGATHHSSTISVPAYPTALVANPFTNKIYVLTENPSVTVIDGATNATKEIALSGNPFYLAIDRFADRVYASYGSIGRTEVIDGKTDTKIAQLDYQNSQAGEMVVDEARSRVYVEDLAQPDSDPPQVGLRVIEEDTLSNGFVGTNPSPSGLAIDPATGTVFIGGMGDGGSGEMSVVTPNNMQAVPIAVDVHGVPDSATLEGLAIFTTSSASPSFAAAVNSSFSPVAPVPASLYYQVDRIKGAWQPAVPASGVNPANFTFSLSNLSPGVHTLYAYASYGDQATTDDASDCNGSAPTPSNIVTYTFAVMPVNVQIYSPVPGSTLTDSSALFQWSAAPDGATFTLSVGTGVGASDIANIDVGTATSATVSNLPIDGSTIYVRLSSLVGGKTYTSDFTYTAVKSEPAVLTSPQPGTTFTDSSATFQWTTGTLVSQYHLMMGSTLGGNDIADLTPQTTTTTVSNLPTNGLRVFVSLSSLIGATWTPRNYIFNASGTNPAARLTSPIAGSTLGTSATFTWSTGTGVSSYLLYIGSAPEWRDIAYVNAGAATSATVETLPANGKAIYVTLYSRVGTLWQPRMYTFFASGSDTAAVLTSPAAGSTLGDSATFTWNPVAGANKYMLWLGSAPATRNFGYFQAGLVTSATIDHLPQNGQLVYATLYTLNGKSWLRNIQSFLASGAGAPSVLLSPTPGSTLRHATATFTWTKGTGVSLYSLYVGTTATRHEFDYYRGTATSYVVNNLPTDGSPVYVTLYSWIGTGWQKNVYKYTAASAP